jgi:hypothetical protein
LQRKLAKKSLLRKNLPNNKYMTEMGSRRRPKRRWAKLPQRKQRDPARIGSMNSETCPWARARITSTFFGGSPGISAIQFRGMSIPLTPRTE